MTLFLTLHHFILILLASSLPFFTGFQNPGFAFSHFSCLCFPTFLAEPQPPCPISQSSPNLTHCVGSRWQSRHRRTRLRSPRPKLAPLMSEWTCSECHQWQRVQELTAVVLLPRPLLPLAQTWSSPLPGPEYETSQAFHPLMFAL